MYIIDIYFFVFRCIKKNDTRTKLSVQFIILYLIWTFDKRQIVYRFYFKLLSSNVNVAFNVIHNGYNVLI